MPSQLARHRNTSRAGHRLGAQALFSAAAAALALAIAPAAANAGNWFYGGLAQNNTFWSFNMAQWGSHPTFSNIRSVYAYADTSNHKVSTGLHDYAQFTEGWYYACHPYSGPHTDSVGINNPHSVQQNPMAGYWEASNTC